MLVTIIKGICIGIAVSAPMGPVGVLCIQRTLREGRLSGFVSGIGATLSDIIYAVISGLGVSFVMDFIDANHYPLQIAGSILLLIAGYFIYKSNPVRKLLKQDDVKASHLKNFISSFFINLSNIGILFFFIAMFARFNFIDPNDSTRNFVGILSIGVGTIIWWFFISSIVDRIRSKFNPRGLKIFNSMLGIILIVIGIVGLVSGVYNITTSVNLI